MGTLMVLTAAPAIAGGAPVPDERSGTYGKREFPTGECVYQSVKGPDTIKSIKIGAPKLFWPDKPGLGSRGKVGYRIELMDNGTLVRRSKVFSGTATKTTSPAFIPRSMSVSPAPDGIYNVWIVAIWYKPDGKKLGSVRHFVPYYKNSTSDFLSWCTTYA